LAAFLWVSGKIEGYDPVNEMLLRDNPALALRYALFAIAVVFAVLGIFDRVQGDSGAWLFTQNALLAVILIYLSRYLNDWLILYHFSHNREVVQEKNSAVAVVEGATYLASAYVIAGAFYDWGKRPMDRAGLVFHRPAHANSAGVSLSARWQRSRRGVGRPESRRRDFPRRFPALRRHGLRRRHQRPVTGLALATYEPWRLISAHGFCLMLVAHFISDKVAFRSSRLSEEVMEQRNIAAALFKAVIFIAVTLGYTHG
jgi:hypothetical protein